VRIGSAAWSPPGMPADSNPPCRRAVRRFSARGVRAVGPARGVRITAKLRRSNKSMLRDSSEKPKLAICRGDDIERHGGSSCMHSQFNLRFHASRSNMRRHNKTLHYYKSLYQQAAIYCSNCTVLLSHHYSGRHSSSGSTDIALLQHSF
jgi:hypothetical protein